MIHGATLVGGSLRDLQDMGVEWDAVALTFAEPVSSTPSNFNRTIEYPESAVALQQRPGAANDSPRLVDQ